MTSPQPLHDVERYSKGLLASMGTIIVLSITLLGIASFGHCTTVPPRQLKPLQLQPSPARYGGRWYMGVDGHAYYCRGPVLKAQYADGTPVKVATFCENGIGPQALVPLKD